MKEPIDITRVFEYYYDLYQKGLDLENFVPEAQNFFKKIMGKDWKAKFLDPKMKKIYDEQQKARQNRIEMLEQTLKQNDKLV